MSDTHDNAFLQRMQRIEALVQELESLSDPAAQTVAQGLVQALMELHATGLENVVQRLAEAPEGRSGAEILNDCARDELVSSILLLHELHPWDLETRVNEAIQKLQAPLRSQGRDLELLSASEEEVRVRLTGSGGGCGSSGQSVYNAIEEAIRDRAPDVDRIEVEGDEVPSQASAPVELTVRQQETGAPDAAMER